MIRRITQFSPISARIVKPQNRILPQYSIGADSVSFSGKPQENLVLSPTAQEALSIQSKLHKLYRSNRISLSTIQETLNQRSPIPIEVKPFQELPNVFNNGTCQAYMQPLYEKDLKIKQAVLYINDDFSNKRTASNTIADSIHEFTHVLQRYRDNDYMGFSKITNDLEEARFLNYIASLTMSDIEGTLIHSVYNNPKFKDTYNKKSRNFTEYTKDEVKQYLPDKRQLLLMMNQFSDNQFQKILSQQKLSSQDIDEFKDFYQKSKPAINEAIIRHFEMESEAKSAEIEARKKGLLSDLSAIFNHSITKSVYDAFLEIMK